MIERGLTGPTVLSVVSGKGGVGKSIVAVNLALQWAREGRRVALIDADIGQGSCPYLLGGNAALRLVTPPAEICEPELALEALDAELALIASDYDLIVVDAPAGVGPAVRWSLDRADASLLVVVDEPTAVADAYALCKLVWQSDPAYPLAGVVNMADSAAEAGQIITRFSSLTTHFLDRKVLYGGWVPFSDDIRRSVRMQIPALDTHADVSMAFEDLGSRVRCGVFETLTPLALN